MSLSTPFNNAPAVNRNRRSQQVAAQLLQHITNGHLPPGSRLPTEAELCENFHVSRTTLREAIQTLRTRGLLDVSPGRGSFVRKPDLHQLTTDLAAALNLVSPPCQAGLGRLLTALLLQAVPTALKASSQARQQAFQLMLLPHNPADNNLQLEHRWQTAFLHLVPASPTHSTVTTDTALAVTVLHLLQQLRQSTRLQQLKHPAELARSSQCQLRAATALMEGDAQRLQQALLHWFSTPQIVAHPTPHAA